MDSNPTGGSGAGSGPATVPGMAGPPADPVSDRMRALLSRAVPAGAVVVVLDERGRSLSSPQLAAELARWRDAGRQDAAFLIGAADGLDPALRDRADLAISLGRMVWPHMLARVMLAEQLYRAATILAGLPYHRA